MILLTFTTNLMDHQLKAVDKIKNVKVGALYMDMGTGKTRTAFELAVSRIKENKVDCLLWLCPVSVKQAIADEVEKHLPNAPYELVETSGIKDWKAIIYIVGIESLSASDALNFLMVDLVNKRRCFIVCDESSLIKNHKAKRTLALWRLAEQAQYKLILNGTPVSNNEQDLYSQWYFLDPRILGYSSFYSFAANHLEYDSRYPGRVVNAHDIEYLVNKMNPFLYQVRKEECLDLPPKTYSSRYYQLTENQKWEYSESKQRILDIVESEYDNWDISTLLFRMFSTLQKVVSGKTWEWKDLFDDPLENPRVQVLLETIESLPHDAKVIIWCKYTHEIEMLKKILTEKKYKVAMLYGELSIKKRTHELSRFKKDARFLIANKHCGAFGLNLQLASYAIYYSNDFSWGTRMQSEDRIHRTGQKNNVHIIDIICENTIDERIYTSLINKESLVDSFRREIDKQKDKKDIWRWLNSSD